MNFSACIDLPPYPAAVLLVIGDHMKQAIRLYKKTFSLTGDFTINDCRGCTLSADNNGHLIYLPKWSNDTKHMAILSHEATHVANRVLQQVGFKFAGWDNDEPQAYLQSYIFEKCLVEIYAGLKP